MATGPEAGDGRQGLLGEIRALREGLERFIKEHEPPDSEAERRWKEFLGRVEDHLDKELPGERKDLMPLREEFDRVISRLRPPRPVKSEELREALESDAQALGVGEEEEKACERWRKELDRLLPKTGQIEKVIVAVHGIGDQSSFGTIQQTAHAFCRYMEVPATFPLGRFHGRSSSVVRALVPTSPPDPEWRGGEQGTAAESKPWPLAFAEIYWANIPRQVVKEGYTLEEAKTWARTLVERLRYKAMQKSPGSAADKVSLRAYEHFGRVIEDMITSVAVAERLLKIVQYTGLGEFQLKKILDDYINDVQVVGEFYSLRRQLLDTFTDVMRQISRSCPGAEIYIVAHSEGTVASFLGLLEGIANEEPWVRDIKGLMTIGSPLNKHVLLWREIFDEYKAPAGEPKHKITWHNYAESGDPIGYNLGITYDWMRNKSGQRWDRFFDFDPKENDHHYAHCPMPGEAHNHYWNDDEVFGHFISNVVDPEGRLLPAGRYEKKPKPRSEWDKWAWSYFLPYVFSTVILLVGTYLLYKSARGVMDPTEAPYESPGSVFWNILALTALVAGTTAFATLPRLLKPVPGLIAASIPFAIGAAVFCWGFTPTHLGAIAKGWAHLLGAPEGRDMWPWGATLVIVLALAAGVLSGVLRWLYPAWGLKPMIYLGALAVALSVGPKIRADLAKEGPAARPAPGVVIQPGSAQTSDQKNPPIWPLLLSGAAFLYLWWLATLLFDITVIWHVYVRWERSQKYLAQIAGEANA